MVVRGCGRSWRQRLDLEVARVECLSGALAQHQVARRRRPLSRSVVDLVWSSLAAKLFDKAPRSRQLVRR